MTRVTALLLAGLLVGCAADTDPGSQAAVAETETSGSAPDQSAPAPENTGESAQNNEESASKTGENPPNPPAKTASVPPVQLLGMSRDDIIKHLGQPAFQRRDRTALLLRYREGRCILDLYLYPRTNGESAKAVDYFEARADDGQMIDTEPCIDAVRKARGAG